MKRKIAALLAADVAGYSRLVAEDEEETLRRLASYRAVFDDFIAKASGRVFNTAGDAVLAEFPSAVEAVRCAIDIQESLRTRNLAYPPSRQMHFRMGITIGDVVERDGDLLGDAVNIAARLEGLAQSGGICVSRAVFEQVANKLSVHFADIGEQQVKNIPTPVHAYTLSMHGADALDSPRSRQKTSWMTSGVAMAAVLALAIGIAAWAYQVASPGLRPVAMAVPQPPGAITRAAAPGETRLASLAAPAALAPIDEQRVRALAAQQEIPLPQNIRLVAPSPSVPKQLAEYVGAWGGGSRWNGVGRQLVMLVTSVDESSASGFLAQGPPNARTSNQFPANVRPFTGTISDKGLYFELVGGKWHYTFKTRPDGYLEGHLEGPDNVRASIALERIN